MSLNSSFADPIQIKDWLDNGLPNDSFSIENAIILELSALQPILIDPQSQANAWLRKQLPDVRILNIQTTRFFTELKLHIKFGSTVIIENVSDSLPRKLYPLFQHAKQ
jgi:dynein heavy chain